MRVGVVTGSVSQLGGGLLDCVRSPALELARRGVEQRVFALRDRQTKKELPAWAPLRPEVFATLGPRFVGFSPGLRRALMESDCELMHSQGIFLWISGHVNAWHRQTGKPYVVSPHGMMDPWALRNSRWKKRIAARFFQDRHLHEAACLHALNEAEAEAMRAYGLRQPIAIIPNGVALPAQRKEIGDRRWEIGGGFGDGRWEMGDGADRLAPSDLPPPIQGSASREVEDPLTRGNSRLGLAPSDLPPPIPATASGDLGYPLARGDSRLRELESRSLEAHPSTKSDLPSAKKLLLFLGRLHPKKGLAELIEAWAKTGQRNDWTLVVAGWGDPGYEESLKGLARARGLKEGVNVKVNESAERERYGRIVSGSWWRVTRNQQHETRNERSNPSSSEPAGEICFVGPVFGEEKQRLLANADGFVLPSHSEGMPVAVLEAWSHAVPVVMTAECNLPEGFQAGAALEVKLKPASGKLSLAEGLEKLVTMKEEERKRMGEKGRKLVEERFTWAEVGSRFVELYRWMVGSSMHKPGFVRE